MRPGEELMLALRDGVLGSPVLERIAGLVHGFTTLPLGSVRPPGRGPPDAVDAALGRDGMRRLQAVQVHGRATWVAGPEPTGPAPVADAIVSRQPGDLLVVRTADCVPVLAAVLRDGHATAVGVIHAGWRGLMAGIVESAVDALAGGPDVVAVLGPSIGACCFEVGPEVAAPFAARFGESLVRPGEGDRSRADLPGAVAACLGSLGVQVLPGPPPCTRCRADLFPSWRRDGPAAGRLGGFIGLRP